MTAMARLPRKISLPGGEERYSMYLYCGLLSYVLVTYTLTGVFDFNVDNYKQLLPFAILVGMAVYALCRRVLGELILYPLQYKIHYWISARRTKEQNLSAYYYFQTQLQERLSAHAARFSVLLLDDAYGIARNYMESVDKPHFWSGARNELHILYLSTVFLCGFAIVSVYHNHHGELAIFGALTIVSMASAIVADSLQQRRELYRFRMFETEIFEQIEMQMLGKSREEVFSKMK
jgi:hypothetical protein